MAEFGVIFDPSSLGSMIHHHSSELKELADSRCGKCHGRGWYWSAAGFASSRQHICRCTYVDGLAVAMAIRKARLEATKEALADTCAALERLIELTGRAASPERIYRP